MRDELGVFFVFLIVAVLISIGMWINSGDYKQGQIDALSGVVKFELVQHPDGTKTWEEKKK